MSKKIVKGKEQPKTQPKKPETEIRLTEDEIKDCKDAFDLFDLDGSGTIDPREVQAALNSLGNNKTPTIFRLLAGIEELGADIDFESFLSHVNERLGHKESKEGVERILELFDAEGTGHLTLSAYRRVTRELGESMTEDEMINSLERISSLGKPELTLDDFYRVMVRKVYGATESVFSLPKIVEEPKPVPKTQNYREEPKIIPKKEEPKIIPKKEEPKPIVKKEEPKPIVKKEEPKPIVKKEEPKSIIKKEQTTSEVVKEGYQSSVTKTSSGVVIKESAEKVEIKETKVKSTKEESRRINVDEESGFVEITEESNFVFEEEKVSISMETHEVNMTADVSSISKLIDDEDQGYQEKSEVVENFSRMKSKGIAKKKKQNLR
ncbi:hypothetical protein SteCoe_30927 [Stentor coeruleus]|uniref:Calmodulin n=1 Tax=Stentor coeruleus TaxID=5963 RepID=A0A1R2B2K7_9CILI|nr:hypothetical protein SteCoe_30927 [Stentor coeruleus]